MKSLKKTYYTFSFVLIIFTLGCSSNSIESVDSVNALIGNQSFIETFGAQPTKETSEKERISTHLKWVLDQLRKADISPLSSNQKLNRLLALNLLDTYQKTEIFPVNTMHEERMPCFRDDNGRLCAMAYLIKNTIGTRAVDEINENNQYSYLLDMDLPLLTKWANEYGLSLVECATIQPTYDHMYKNPGDGRIPKPTKVEDGYHKLYNQNKQVWMDGEFKNGKLYNGKLYIYDENGLLEKIEIYKKGKYHSDAQLKLE